MTSTRFPSPPRAGLADVVLVGGNVLTLEGPRSREKAVAIAGDRIVGVGDDRDLAGLIGPRTRVVDLAGRTVLPGLIDQHLHLDQMAASRSGRIADLRAPVPTVAAMIARVATHAAQRPDDRWIVGGGWSEGTIAEVADGRRAVDRRELDAAFPDRPVLLRHFSLHAALANGVALREAGIDAHTGDPDGGQIVRDHAGEPTGLLLESAVNMVGKRIPGLTPAQRLAELRDAMTALNRLGVTSVTDPLVSPASLRDYAALRRDGDPTVRMHALMHWGDAVAPGRSATIERALADSGLTTGLGDEWLTVLGGKLFADGVPSQRTAWVDAPYAGSDERGGLVLDGTDDRERVAELHRCIALLHRQRMAVQVHAVGDAAGAAVAEGFARVQREDPWPDARHVLIHGVMLRDETIELLAANGVGVTTNALIRYHAAPAMRPHLGDARWETTVAVRRLLDRGVRVSDSSDAPVVESDWRLAMQALVTRETVESDGAAVGPAEAITPFEALRAWTTEAAYQQHADARKGSIAVGKLADLAVVDGDPLSVPPDRLHALEPLATLVGGRVVHDRDGLLDAGP